MDQNHYFDGAFHQRSSSIKVIFQHRSSSIEGHLPSKAVFHQRWSSIKGCLPSKVVFHKSRPPSAQLLLNRFFDRNTPLQHFMNIVPQLLLRYNIGQFGTLWAPVSKRPSIYLLDSLPQEVINNNPTLAIFIWMAGVFVSISFDNPQRRGHSLT